MFTAGCAILFAPIGGTASLGLPNAYAYDGTGSVKIPASTNLGFNPNGSPATNRPIPPV